MRLITDPTQYQDKITVKCGGQSLRMLCLAIPLVVTLLSLFWYFWYHYQYVVVVVSLIGCCVISRGWGGGSSPSTNNDQDQPSAQVFEPIKCCFRMYDRAGKVLFACSENGVYPIHIAVNDAVMDPAKASLVDVRLDVSCCKTCVLHSMCAAKRVLPLTKDA